MKRSARDIHPAYTRGSGAGSRPGDEAAIVQKVIDLAMGPPLGETTHWTGRMLAKAAGISLRSSAIIPAALSRASPAAPSRPSSHFPRSRW